MTFVKGERKTTTPLLPRRNLSSRTEENSRIPELKAVT
jgi:hypothetical protein